MFGMFIVATSFLLAGKEFWHLRQEVLHGRVHYAKARADRGWRSRMWVGETEGETHRNGEAETKWERERERERGREREREMFAATRSSCRCSIVFVGYAILTPSGCTG